MKILIVDDEQDLCEILQYNLEKEGYAITTANSAEEALQLPLHEYGLFLLDVMMGEMSGFQLAQTLKNDPRTAQTPIIFITALANEDSTVQGLEIGADDYVAKPLSLREVKARINAVLRRSLPGETRLPAQNPNLFRYEGITLNLDAKSAALDGRELPLTKLEFELLSLFLQNAGRVFGRNDLIANCWPGDTYVLDRTVDVSINRLRKKMGNYGKQIKTRVGYGYYFEK